MMPPWSVWMTTVNHPLTLHQVAQASKQVQTALVHKLVTASVRAGDEAARKDASEVLLRPGGNPGANGWFLESTPIQMPPRRGDIFGGLT